jgi:SAM-dependent methyltransferase
MHPILVIILLAFLGTFAYAGKSAAPWFDIDRFLKLAEFKPGMKFYDLGCGDGKLVFAASRAGAQASGYEISLLPYLIAKAKSFFIKDTSIQFKNFWNANLSDADIVYLFLTPKVNPKAKEKLERELKPGSRVVAYTWPIEGWQAEKEDFASGQPSIYLYIVK